MIWAYWLGAVVVYVVIAGVTAEYYRPRFDDGFHIPCGIFWPVAIVIGTALAIAKFGADFVRVLRASMGIEEPPQRPKRPAGPGDTAGW